MTQKTKTHALMDKGKGNGAPIATIVRQPNPGWFQPGPDPRRHKFTREECCRGYQAAWKSLETRFPGCDPHFLLCAIMGSQPWHTLPQIRALLDRDEPLRDAEALRLFGSKEATP